MTSNTDDKSLSERIINGFKSKRLVAYSIVIATAIGGVATFMDSVQKIVAMIAATELDGAVPIVLPKNTGWLFVGYYNNHQGFYTKGPYYEVIRSPYPQKDNIPRINELIKLTASRRIIISDFATKGLTKQFEAPWKENMIDDSDDTGLKLSKGAVIEVRDVSLGAFPERDAAVWVRVGSAE